MYAADPHAMAVALEAQRLLDLCDCRLNAPEWASGVDRPGARCPKRSVLRDETR